MATTAANATSTLPACSAPASSGSVSASGSGSIPATTTSTEYVVPTCIPEPSGNITYSVSYTSSGTTSLPFIVPLTVSTNATATSVPVTTSTPLSAVTTGSSGTSTVVVTSAPTSASSIANGNSTSTSTFASSVPVTTSAPATTSPATSRVESTSAPSTPSMSSSRVPEIASTSQAANTTSAAPTSRTVSRPTVTITEIYTGPPAGTPSLSRTSSAPATTSVQPVPTTTTQEPVPTTSRAPESTAPPSTAQPTLPSSNSFSYYTETLTFPSTTVLSIITTSDDSFPTSFPTTSLPISSVNDPSSTSTPFSSYVDSLSSSATPSPTLIGTVTPSGALTTITTPIDQTPPTSPTTSTTTSATISALPAPEGSNAEPTTATATNPSGVIAGGTVAGVVGLIALAGVSRWVWKRGAGERAVRRMYRDDMRQIRERTYGLEEGPGQWGRPAWRRGPGSTEGSV